MAAMVAVVTAEDAADLVADVAVSAEDVANLATRGWKRRWEMATTVEWKRRWVTVVATATRWVTATTWECRWAEDVVRAAREVPVLDADPVLEAVRRCGPEACSVRLPLRLSIKRSVWLPRLLPRNSKSDFAVVISEPC